MMTLPRVQESLEKLETAAFEVVQDAQTSIWGDDPAHIVYCHARLLQAEFEAPRKIWRWDHIRFSWDAICKRNRLFFVEDWMAKHEARVAQFIVQNAPRAGEPPDEQLHALERA